MLAVTACEVEPPEAPSPATELQRSSQDDPAGRAGADADVAPGPEPTEEAAEPAIYDVEGFAVAHLSATDGLNHVLLDERRRAELEASWDRAVEAITGHDLAVVRWRGRAAGAPLDHGSS